MGWGGGGWGTDEVISASDMKQSILYLWKKFYLWCIYLYIYICDKNTQNAVESDTTDENKI